MFQKVTYKNDISSIIKFLVSVPHGDDLLDRNVQWIPMKTSVNKEAVSTVIKVHLIIINFVISKHTRMQNLKKVHI
jgi:hypothetical protein